MNEASVKSEAALAIEKLRQGKRAERIIAWPGSNGDVQFALVPLTMDELQEAYAGAYQRFKHLNLQVDMLNADDFHSEVNVQVLARSMRAITDDQRKRPAFRNADELRALLQPETRDALSTEFLELAKETNPNPTELSEPLLVQIEELVKKKDAIRLAAFGSSTLACYLTGTAGRSTS